MFRLVYSNSPEALLDALAENLGADRDLFEPMRLVVPNRTVETYLKLGLASRLGVVARPEVRSLHKFWEHLLSTSDTSARLLTRDVLQGFLLSILFDDDALAASELSAARDYIHGAGVGHDAVARRRFELSEQLARLFDQYVLNRPELPIAWTHRSTLDHKDEFSDVERWQRALWLSIFGPEGRIEREASETGVHWVSLADLARRPGPLRVESPHHIFGFSSFSPISLELLGRVEARDELILYVANPSREYWGEAVSKRGARQLDLLEAGAPSHPVLDLWGRAGRDTIRRLNEIVDWNFEERFCAPPASANTTLGRLQSDILELAREVGPKSTGDESIKILACPSVRREVEVVASRIWHLVEHSSAEAPLRFNEIAVWVGGADPATYLTHIASVFRETYDLPHNIIDLPLSADSRFLEAIELLLALPLSEFGREDVLRLVTHPAVVAGFWDAEPDEWVGWCEQLGIIYGADRSALEGTYVERDLLTWDQGLRRLALGAFMTGARSGDERSLSIAEQAYLPEEYPQSSAKNAARFSMLVRTLIGDAKSASREPRSMRVWASFVLQLINRHLTPRGDDDERALRRATRAIQSLEDLGVGDEPLPYVVAHELILARLGVLTSGRGQHLADGVVVAPLRPGRVLPMRATFLLGLGEGRFPAPHGLNHLDLRNAGTRLGDVSTREKDEFAFLEALLRTSEQLSISYVARDELTGEELQPSSVVHDLRRILESRYLDRESASRRVEVHPLRRYDRQYAEQVLPSYSPHAEVETRARALGADLRAAIGSERGLSLDELRKNLPGAEWKKIATLLSEVEPPPVSLSSDQVERRTLRLSNVRRFLECPLQGSASVVLGLKDDQEDDPISRDEERFSTEPLARYPLLTEVFVEALEMGLSPEQTEALYRERAATLELRALAPTGVFVEVEHQANLGVLAGWRGALRALSPEPELVVHRLGRASEDVRHGRVVPPVELEVEPFGRRGQRKIAVELVGSTSPILLESSTSVILRIRPSVSKELSKLDRQRLTLRGYVDQLALGALGLSTGERHRTAVLIGDSTGHHRVHVASFRAQSKDRARSRLRSLVAELLSGVHSYLLPVEAVFMQKDSRFPTTLEREIRRLFDGRQFFTTRSGPVPDVDPELFMPLEESLAKEYARDRLGPLLDTLVLESGGTR